METLSPAAQDDSTGANPSSTKSEDSSPRQESGRGSPPPNCAICLGTCRNKSFTDSCLHQFCFKCLLTWSKVKAECPLCKQNFRSIIHNVRSNHQYEEYMVEQRHTEDAVDRIDIDSLTTATRRFRYRTTLTLPRRETIAIQQLLVHYPFMADVFPAPAPRTPPARRRRSPAAFRRTVYRHNLWARPLPDFTGRFRDCTPEFYRYNDTQMHRLVPWLNRELHYLLNENIGHMSYVLTRILELLPQHHINSGEFREAMHRYFGDRTEHFLHELYCFASTPYDMQGYDRNVQYTTDTRISTMVNEVISSSESDASVDSDIVMVSHSEPAEPPPGPSRLPAPVYPQNYIPPPPVDNVIPIETISHSDTDDDSEEVVVVGYIKPPQDRTPEVVDLLGSDSDVIVQDSVQPEPTQSTSRDVQTVPEQPTNLVKLSLKRHKTPEYDSDSDLSYRPAARRRRNRLLHENTTSDTSRSTPSPANWSATYSPAFTQPSYTPPVSPTITTPSPSPFTDSSYNSTERRKVTKKKSKRKTHRTTKTAEKKKTKKRSRSRSHHRDRRDSPAAAEPERDKRSKRKSHSGKGVKSSRKVDATAAPVPQPSVDSEQPGTSGATDRHRTERRPTSRESRRLRSVVNVMFSHKTSGDSSPSGNSSVCAGKSSSGGSVAGEERYLRPRDAPDDAGGSRDGELSAGRPSDPTDSDSEDNLPLNLTMQKTCSFCEM